MDHLGPFPHQSSQHHDPCGRKFIMFGQFGATPFAGNQATGQTTGGLFGMQNVFGQSTGQPNTGTTTGVFGSPNTSSAGLFGNTNTQQTSAFGNPSAFGQTNTPAGGGGLFGQPQQQQQGGLFGIKPGNTTTSLFGNPTSPTQPTAPSLFGTTTSPFNQQRPSGTNTISTGVFGSFGSSAPTATGTSLFGGAPQGTGTGIFGSTELGTQSINFEPVFDAQKVGKVQSIMGDKNVASRGKPLFMLRYEDYLLASGQNANMYQSKSPQTSGFFGVAPINQTTGSSLFGQPAGSTGNIFGTSTFAQQQQQPQQQQQAGMFGTKSLFGGPTATTSLFGAPAQQQSQAPQNTLFGSAPTASSQTGTGFFGGNTTCVPAAGTQGFGAAQTSSAFGTQQQPSSGFSGSLFGPKPATGPTSSLFGSGTTSGNLFGTTPTTVQQPQQGGLFGQPTTGGGLGMADGSGTTNTGTTSSLFGGLNAGKPGGVFGAPGGNTQTGGLFGAPTSGVSSGGSSLFGQQGTGQPQTTQSLFGGGTIGQGTTGLGSTNLFGGQAAASPTFGGSSSLFGNAGGSNLWGRPGGITSPLKDTQSFMQGGGNQVSPLLAPPIGDPYDLSRLVIANAAALIWGQPFSPTVPKSRPSLVSDLDVSSRSWKPLARSAYAESVTHRGTPRCETALTGENQHQPALETAAITSETPSRLSRSPLPSPVLISTFPSSTDPLPSQRRTSRVSVIAAPQRDVGSGGPFHFVALPVEEEGEQGEEKHGDEEITPWIRPSMRVSESTPTNSFRYDEPVSSRRSPSGYRAAPSLLVPTLTDKSYEVKPSIEAMKQYSEEGLAQVEDFTISRANYGAITWPGFTDVRGLDIDATVDIQKNSVELFGDKWKASMKRRILGDSADDETAEDIPEPAVGEGLNKPAIVTLYNCKPVDLDSRAQYTEEQLRKAFDAQEQLLIRYTKGMNASFLSLSEDWTWRFRVEHFSRYAMPTAPVSMIPVKKVGKTRHPILMGSKETSMGIRRPVRPLARTMLVHHPLAGNPSRPAATPPKILTQEEACSLAQLAIDHFEASIDCLRPENDDKYDTLVAAKLNGFTDKFIRDWKSSRIAPVATTERNVTKPGIKSNIKIPPFWKEWSKLLENPNKVLYLKSIQNVLISGLNIEYQSNASLTDQSVFELSLSMLSHRSAPLKAVSVWLARLNSQWFDKNQPKEDPVILAIYLVLSKRAESAADLLRSNGYTRLALVVQSVETAPSSLILELLENYRKEEIDKFVAPNVLSLLNLLAGNIDIHILKLMPQWTFSLAAILWFELAGDILILAAERENQLEQIAMATNTLEKFLCGFNPRTVDYRLLQALINKTPGSFWYQEGNVDDLYLYHSCLFVCLAYVGSWFEGITAYEFLNENSGRVVVPGVSQMKSGGTLNGFENWPLGCLWLIVDGLVYGSPTSSILLNLENMIAEYIDCRKAYELDSNRAKIEYLSYIEDVLGIPRFFVHIAVAQKMNSIGKKTICSRLWMSAYEDLISNETNKNDIASWWSILRARAPDYGHYSASDCIKYSIKCLMDDGFLEQKVLECAAILTVPEKTLNAILSQPPEQQQFLKWLERFVFDQSTRIFCCNKISAQLLQGLDSIEAQAHLQWEQHLASWHNFIRWIVITLQTLYQAMPKLRSDDEFQNTATNAKKEELSLLILVPHESSSDCSPGLEPVIPVHSSNKHISKWIYHSNKLLNTSSIKSISCRVELRTCVHNLVRIAQAFENIKK